MVPIMRQGPLQVFSGNANSALAREICAALGVTMAEASVRQFADGEIHLQIQENVRAMRCLITPPP